MNLQGSGGNLVPMLEAMVSSGSVDPRLISVGAVAGLSTPPDVFVGRHRELRALHLMFEDESDRAPVLAIITGPGGIGKSALVAQAIRHYAGTYKAALWLHCQRDLSSDPFLSFLLPIDAFLKRLGTSGFLAEGEPQLSTKAKVDKAVLALNIVGPVLLIIENLENVQKNDDQMISDQDFLHLLHAFLTNLHGGRVLITGRFMVKELLVQEMFDTRFLHLHLGDLSPKETRQLMLHYPQVAQWNKIDGALIQNFGGLPYVYNLLSSKFANENLEQILYEVREYITGQPEKAFRQMRAAEELQKVRDEVVTFATLEAIVRRLSTASLTLLAQLSVLQRPFPLGLMEKGLRAARTTWQQLLDGSLLHYEPLEQTYLLHSITRRYAEDLLSKLHPPSPYARLAAWYENYADHESHDLEDYQEARRLWNAAGNHQRAGELVVTKLASILGRSGEYRELGKLSGTTLDDIPQTAEAADKDIREFEVTVEEAYMKAFASVDSDLSDYAGHGLRGRIARRQIRKFVLK